MHDDERERGELLDSALHERVADAALVVLDVPPVRARAAQQPRHLAVGAVALQFHEFQANALPTLDVEKVHVIQYTPPWNYASISYVYRTIQYGGCQIATLPVLDSIETMETEALLDATLCYMGPRTRLDVSAIAQQLADRRAEKRLEQTEVAERAGLSRAYISRLEKGLVPNPKLLDLAQVAAVLDVPLGALLTPSASGARDLKIEEGADLLVRLREEDPDVAESILSWWRQSFEIVRLNRLGRTN